MLNTNELKIRFNINHGVCVADAVSDEEAEANKVFYEIMKLFYKNTRLTVTPRDRNLIPINNIHHYLKRLDPDSPNQRVLDSSLVPSQWGNQGDPNKNTQSLIGINAYTLWADSDQNVEKIVLPHNWRHILGRAVHVELYSSAIDATLYFSSSKVHDVYDVRMLFNNYLDYPDRVAWAGSSFKSLEHVKRAESFVRKLFQLAELRSAFLKLAA